MGGDELAVCGGTASSVERISPSRASQLARVAPRALPGSRPRARGRPRRARRPGPAAPRRPASGPSRRGGRIRPARLPRRSDGSSACRSESARAARRGPRRRTGRRRSRRSGCPPPGPRRCRPAASESSISARSWALSWKSWGLVPSGMICSTVASSPAICSVMSAQIPVVAAIVGPSLSSLGAATGDGEDGQAAGRQRAERPLASSEGAVTNENHYQNARRSDRTSAGMPLDRARSPTPATGTSGSRTCVPVVIVLAAVRARPSGISAGRTRAERGQERGLAAAPTGSASATTKPLTATSTIEAPGREVEVPARAEPERGARGGDRGGEHHHHRQPLGEQGRGGRRARSAGRAPAGRRRPGTRSRPRA